MTTKLLCYFNLKHYLKLYWLLIFCLIFSLAYAQKNRVTISGNIRNLVDKEDIIGATASVKKLGIGVVSNEYGFYSLSLPKGVHEIIYSYVGNKTRILKVNLQRDTVINIDMRTDVTALEEVTVTAQTRDQNKVTSTEISTQKMKMEVIKKLPVVLGEVDIIKSLELLPGITSLGEGASGFSVRGGKVDQNLILLDELTIYNSSHVFGFLSVFNGDAIKDVKIYKAAIPAKYGGRISSVLDIRQKEGNYEKFSGRGGIGVLASRLLLEGPLFNGKGSFMVAGRRSYVDLFLKTKKEFKNTRANFYDLNFKTNVRLNDNNRLFISGYSGRDQFKFKSLFDNKWGNDAINLRWNHIFNNKLFLLTSINYSSYTYDLNFNIDFTDIEWKSNIKNYNLKANFDHFVNNKIKARYGLDNIYYEFNPGEVTSSSFNKEKNKKTTKTTKLDDKYALESAIYADIDYKVNDKLTLSLGSRYSMFWRLGEQNVHNYLNDEPVKYITEIDLYEAGTSIGTTYYNKNKKIHSYSNIEPRLSLVYLIDDNNSIKLGYQNIAQYIHLISNYNSPTPLDIWAPSGKYIKPSTSQQANFGFFKNIAERKYELSIEAYYKEMKDIVEYIDGADLVGNNTIETEILTGYGRAYGLELYFEKKIGNLTGWLSYTLSKAEQKIPGLGKGDKGINNGEYFPLGIDKTHDLSVSGTYRINDKFTLSGNFIYQTGRPATYPSGMYYDEHLGRNTPYYTSRYNSRYPAYHRLDVALIFNPRKNKNRKWKVSHVLGIYNIYDRRNANSIYFDDLENNSGTSNNQATKLSIFGIVPSYTFNFKF